MAYSSDVAAVLTDQLTRFASLNRHQLAGQLANLEFWLNEVKHCQGVIDGYPARFARLKATQRDYVKQHNTQVMYPEVAHDLTTPTSPRRVPDEELETGRRDLCEAAYRFLIRCHHEGLLDEAALKEAADSIGVGIDLADLRR